MNDFSGKTVLLTLGRLPVALDIARSFHALGWYVIVAEPASMHLARMSRSVSRCLPVTSPVDDAARYAADIENIVAAHGVDLVVPVSEESMHVAALHGRLPPGVELFCMPQSRMLELHDKYRFTLLARKYGLRVPESAPASDPRPAITGYSRGFVLKPRYSCSGRGVTFHAGDSRVASRDDMLVQQRLDGPQFSSFSIAHAGRVLASSVYRGTVTDGSVAVCFERVDDVPAIGDWSSEFIRQSGHTGFIAFDFVADDHGSVAAIECNPRATSGIHFLSTAVIAPLILDRPVAAPAFKVAARLTESYSCFTSTLAALFTKKSFRYRLSELRGARDVTWSPADPWPFLLMMLNSYRILWLALTKRVSFAAAAVLDIEWREPDAK